jgi:hypothetical protein
MAAAALAMIASRRTSGPAFRRCSFGPVDDVGDADDDLVGDG